MAANVLLIVIFKILFSTISCNYVYQYPTSQYPQQSYTPYSTPPQTYSKPAYAPEYKPYSNFQPYQPAQANFVYPKLEPATTPCPKAKQEPIIEPVLPIVPTPAAVEKPKNPGFDTNVLNNLAIALQLLIVSNIINSPPSESNSISPLDNFPVNPCKEFENTQFKSIMDAMPDFQRMTPPNSKFLGDADVMSFGKFGSFPKPPSRPSGLMSPYEAMNANSFADRPKYNPKKDFQSPYSAMLAFDNHKDLFSMTDLFQN